MYRISSGHVDRLLQGMKEELDRAGLSESQQLYFIFLQITLYAIPLSLLVVWLTFEGAGSQGLATASCLVAAILFGVALLSLVVLVPLNLPLIRSFWRQLRLFHKLQLFLPDQVATLTLPERPPTVERRLRNFAWALMVLIVVVVGFAVFGKVDPLSVVVLTLVIGVPAYFIITKKTLPLAALRIGLWVVLGAMAVGLVSAFFMGVTAFFTVAIVVLLPALVLVLSRYLKRLEMSLEVVRDAAGLRHSLLRKRRLARRENRDYLDLSSDEAQRLEGLERALIRESRTRAIESARASETRGYTVFKGVTVREALGRLEPLKRLEVATQIQELSRDPRPPGAREEGAGSQTWRLPVADTGVELSYIVADQERQVKVVGIRFVEDGPEGRADG